MDHAVEVRHLAIGIGQEREVQGGALRLGDVADPALVRLERVDREARLP
jgi:hypothetical protein